VSYAYSDMDRLIIERWSDVTGLIEAHEDTQNRIEQMIEVVGERLSRWARPRGYEIETQGKGAEFKAAKSSWIDRRKGARVQLTVGGFCPTGYKKMDADHPYLWVHIDNLASFRFKEPELVAFSHALRTALGTEARSWEASDVDDTDGPLGRHLTSISDMDRAQLIASEDALFDFVTAHFPTLFALSDIIDAELAKMQR
jgi:hypothetical protein